LPKTKKADLKVGTTSRNRLPGKAGALVVPAFKPAERKAAAAIVRAVRPADHPTRLSEYQD
jgi:hypothetical protein